MKSRLLAEALSIPSYLVGASVAPAFSPKEAKAALLAKQEELLIHMVAIRGDVLIDQAADPMDRAMSLNSRDAAALDVSRTRSLLDQVDAALERIRNGSYSICDSCDEAISLRRLKAVPWALYCIPCQEAHERQHAVGGDSSHHCVGL